MLTNKKIEDYANYDFSEENLDEWNGFLKGAHWANHQNSIEIAAKDAEIEELVEALFYLRNRVGQTEENVSGLYREQWDRATAVLKKYGK